MRYEVLLCFLPCYFFLMRPCDIQVFFGPRSLVYQEADNRKWTIMALFEYVDRFCSRSSIFDGGWLVL